MEAVQAVGRARDERKRDLDNILFIHMRTSKIIEVVHSGQKGYELAKRPIEYEKDR